MSGVSTAPERRAFVQLRLTKSGTKVTVERAAPRRRGRPGGDDRAALNGEMEQRLRRAAFPREEGGKHECRRASSETITGENQA
jgi:hypothetical protein